MVGRRVPPHRSLGTLGVNACVPPQVFRVCVTGIWLLLATCTSPGERQRDNVKAPLLPFEDLFVLDDTVRLDPDVVIGNVSFMDIAPEGHLLVSDRVNNRAYLLDEAGSHQSTFDPSSCLPERGGMIRSARLVSNGRVIYRGSSGQMVVFTAEGGCEATRVVQQSGTGACVSGDTLYVLPHLSSFRRHATVAYSLDLKEIGTIRIAMPERPRLYSAINGMLNRAMECFEDGPYYTYGGRADAAPIRPRAILVQAHPPFFVEQSQDLPRGVGPAVLTQKIMERTINAGILSIDHRTRLVVYWLGAEWHPGSEWQAGLVVASDTDQFPARSALSPVVPVGAANGYIYGVGDNEPLPDGDIGNPVILRYKFIPPSDAAP